MSAGAAVGRTSEQEGADDVRWLAAAVAIARKNVLDGGGPFGALVVEDGLILADGVNRVTLDNDPTAHAEVTAIREACRERRDFRLDGTVLYTSCEPCPLCLAACLWARVDRVVFAADRHDAARGGFDDLEFYELFARDRSTWTTPAVLGVRVKDCVSPFDTWLANEHRVDY